MLRVSRLNAAPQSQPLPFAPALRADCSAHYVCSRARRAKRGPGFARGACARFATLAGPATAAPALWAVTSMAFGPSSRCVSPLRSRGPRFAWRAGQAPQTLTRAGARYRVSPSGSRDHGSGSPRPDSGESGGKAERFPPKCAAALPRCALGPRGVTVSNSISESVGAVI